MDISKTKFEDLPPDVRAAHWAKFDKVVKTALQGTQKTISEISDGMLPATAGREAGQRLVGFLLEWAASEASAMRGGAGDDEFVDNARAAFTRVSLDR